MFLFQHFSKSLCGLEGWNVVLGNDERGVFANVASCFLSPLFHNETSKSTEEYVLLVCERILHGLHKCFYGREDALLVNASSLGNFVDDVCFCHDCFFSVVIMVYNN